MYPETTGINGTDGHMLDQMTLLINVNTTNNNNNDNDNDNSQHHSLPHYKCKWSILGNDNNYDYDYDNDNGQHHPINWRGL